MSLSNRFHPNDMAKVDDCIKTLKLVDDTSQVNEIEDPLMQELKSKPSVYDEMSLPVSVPQKTVSNFQTNRELLPRQFTILKSV